jgi:uncharacterized protein (UPF0333 family)
MSSRKIIKRKAVFKNKTRGQLSIELSILVFCIAAALLAMGAYIKRGIQGRLRQTADNIGTIAYAPGETNTNSETSKTLNRKTQVEVYTEPGTAELPNNGGSVDGRYTYRKEDILKETLEEDVNETVQ